MSVGLITDINDQTLQTRKFSDKSLKSRKKDSGAFKSKFSVLSITGKRGVI